MEIEYSPGHSAGGGGSTVNLLSPTHAHGSPANSFAAIRELRRTLSRSPSKPQRFSLHARKSTNGSPDVPRSPSLLTRAFSADACTDNAIRVAQSQMRSGHIRTASRRTSPNSPLRRALSDNVNHANASPKLTRRSSAEGQENQDTMDCSHDPLTSTHGVEQTKVDFLKPEGLLKPIRQDHASPMKSSPLKRSDGVMNLDAAGCSSPRHKRRSLHGPSCLGSDFTIFDHGLDGTASDSAESIASRSSDEKERDSSAASTPGWQAPTANSPQRRPFSLRKSTIQQRNGGARSRHLAEPARELGLNPALTRARSRISLDSALPLRSLDFDSPSRRINVSDPPVFFAPPAQKPYQSAPKPHPLSYALTPSSSSSSVVDDLSQPTQQPPVPSVFRTQPMRPPANFSNSLPPDALRTATHSDMPSSQTSSQGSFATPEVLRMARPMAQAFHSTGLISKRNRNVELSDSQFGSSHMPDTPSKKASAPINIGSSPAPPSVLGQVARPVHEFGSPSTPFNARTSKISPESFGKGVNIFGSLVGAPQLARRGSFFSIDGADELSDSPTRRLDSNSTSDDLPPTPTKSALVPARPQSKGKSNSLRSSLFGRRASLGPDTFASPADQENSAETEDESSKYTYLPDASHAPLEEDSRLAADMLAQRSITISACNPPSPPQRRTRAVSSTHASSPTPLAKRPLPSVPDMCAHSGAFTETLTSTVANANQDDSISEKSSPHTPQETQDTFAPPDPSNLSISAEQRPRTALGRSTSHFPPATPTGPRSEHASSTGFFPADASSSYFANDVDTSLTARFSKISISGMGEFSQVYRVEKPLFGATSSHTQSSHGAKVWAVKKSRKPYTGNKDRQRKMREVEILRALRGHEHVIELVDSWEAKGHLYIQTEFCENGNLKDFLLTTGYKARLDDFRIWKILLELARGLKSIHNANFMHLDLKPANVFIDWEGVLKIGDFGMASTWPAPAHLEGEGDREYIGPEVLAGRFDKPADIFALGMVMLEIGGNIVLPDNGESWQRLRAGDLSDLPSLTWTSDSSLIRDESGDPVETPPAADATALGGFDDELSFLRPAIQAHRRKGSRGLVTPPRFMVDPCDPDALDQIVSWMISPNPASRPTVDQLLQAGGVRWVGQRRRAGATVYEGSWGPADIVVSPTQDVDMMDT